MDSYEQAHESRMLIKEEITSDFEDEELTHGLKQRAHVISNETNVDDGNISKDDVKKEIEDYWRTNQIGLNKEQSQDHGSIRSNSDSPTDPLDVNKKYKCNECGKAYNYKSSISKHLAAHSRPNRYECNECGKVYAHKSPFTNHLSTHRLMCDICCKGCLSATHLARHLKVHEEEANAYTCNVCGKVLDTKAIFYKHMHGHKMAGLEKRLECGDCGKKFKTTQCLKNHVRTHTRGKDFLCNVCGKQFTSYGNLQGHKLLHDDKKHFKCDVCQKEFTFKRNLNSHSTIHYEKKYKCDICNKAFRFSKCLKLHNLVHTKEKPHECKDCGKRFARIGTLTGHMVVHTGLKKFDCKICGKFFSQRSSRNLHKRVHEREKIKEIVKGESESVGSKLDSVDDKIAETIMNVNSRS